MEETKKVPFFKRIIISIKDLDKYNILISEKLGRAIVYFLILMLMFTVILSGSMTYRTGKLIDEACQYVKNETPDYKVNEEGLHIEGNEALIIDDLNSISLKIILDDNEETIEKYKETIENYSGSTILALKNKIVLITNGRELSLEYSKIKEEYDKEKQENDKDKQEVKEQNNKENGNLINNKTEKSSSEEITKQDILNLINNNKMQIYSNIFMTMFGIVYCMYGISTFIDALALSLLALIISKMARVRLAYAQDLNLSISALTLPIILNLVFLCANVIADFEMPYFQVMYTIISYIYIIAVILIMRSDMIKKKQMIKATIEIKDLEKKQEDIREEKQDENVDKRKEDKKDSEEKEDQDKNESKTNDKGSEEGLLEKAKDKVKGKLKNEKEGTATQANIEERKI